MEIELKNKSRGLPAVAAMKEISSVSKTFRDAAPKHETSLISADQTGDKRLQPGGEDFGQAFYGGVLKGDWPKIMSLPGFILFWQKETD
jgi:hypothetical protein